MERDKVIEAKIKESGIFNFAELYEFLYDWLNEESYKLKEKKYSEKVMGDVKTIEIEWDADKKVSDYFKFRLELRWQITGLKKIEVKKEDQKVTMNSGSVEIKFRAWVLKDYEGRWENKPVWKFLRGVYDRYIIRHRNDQYEDKVEDEMKEMVAQTKAFLALEAKR